MAESVVNISQAFSPSILLGPPSSLSFTVNEGEGISLPQSFSITNNGSFSSLLNFQVTPADSYVRLSGVQPYPGIPQNESRSFQASVDSTNLIAASSPYASSLTISSSQATNSPQNLPITITVRPKAIISLSSISLTFTVVKPLTGSFPPIPDQILTVTNTGPAGSLLDFQVRKLSGLSPWLTTLSPSSGSLGSSSSQNIQISVVPPDSMLPGTYTEIIRISGYSSNKIADCTVILQVVL